MGYFEKSKLTDESRSVDNCVNVTLITYSILCVVRNAFGLGIDALSKQIVTRQCLIEAVN